MKNQKMWKGLVIGLCISALTGCGTGADEKTGGGNMPVKEYQSSIFDDEDMHSDENDNIAPKADNTDGNSSQENKDSSLPDGNGTNGARVMPQIMVQLRKWMQTACIHQRLSQGALWNFRMAAVQ